MGCAKSKSEQPVGSGRQPNAEKLASCPKVMDLTSWAGIDVSRLGQRKSVTASGDKAMFPQYAAMEASLEESAQKVQGMVRKRRSKLEARLQRAADLHEEVEYAEERKQHKTIDRFLDQVKDMGGKVDVEDPDIEGIEIPDDYTGIRLPDGLTKDALLDLMDRLYAQAMGEAQERVKVGLKNLLHVKYALRIASEFVTKLSSVPNVVHVSTALSQRLTVVGDLHGQLRDLVHIVRHNGLPSFDNPYLINGDLVDRGDYSVEIVLLLMGLSLVEPFSVMINRGNHEDRAVCMMYGFRAEFDLKYSLSSPHGRQLYRLFEAAFARLPLAHVIDNQILVVHGGLTDKLMNFEKLKHIDRASFPSVSGPRLNLKKKKEEDHHPFDIVKDLLWSDPSYDETKTKCVHNTHRGSGVLFPPHFTHKWLDKHKLGVLIRSHQCKYAGYEVAHYGRCLTVFSASNYYAQGHAENDGAILVLQPPHTAKVLTYRTAYSTDPPPPLAAAVAHLERNALRRVESTLLENRYELMATFERLDAQQTGFITLKEWASAMNITVPMHLPWAHLAHKFVDVVPDSNLVDYRPLLHKLQVVFASQEGNETLYRHRHELTMLFHLLDVNSNGQLDRVSLTKAVELVNKSRAGNAPRLTASDVNQFLDQLDADHNGAISFSEFYAELSHRAAPKHKRYFS